jgi:hypothetical protein
MLTLILGSGFPHHDVIGGEKLKYEHLPSSQDLAESFVIGEACPIIVEVKGNIRSPVHGCIC